MTYYYTFNNIDFDKFVWFFFNNRYIINYCKHILYSFADYKYINKLYILTIKWWYSQGNQRVVFSELSEATIVATNFLMCIENTFLGTY